eukprot:jgi/Orpsp1_1/1188425/evm.model.d7180000064711.1
MINCSDLNDQNCQNMNINIMKKDDKENFNNLYNSNYDNVNIFNNNNNNNFNNQENSNYHDDYSISIPYACHEIFSILVPYIRFPEYIDKIITIIYKIIPYLSFYIELVINLSTTNDKYILFENTVLYYVSLILEIIGFYSEGDEYYINQWNELLNIELNYEYNSINGTNTSIFSSNMNDNKGKEFKIPGIENENKLEKKAIFSHIIYNREILIKLILDLLCNLINVSNHDSYSIIFWNAIDYVINIPSSHGIPSTLINKLFNSNDIQINDLNLLIHFMNHPQIWVRKHTLFELVQIEKNNGLKDNDIQIQQLTKLFIKYFINSDPGNLILYNLILWLQVYNDKGNDDDIYSLALVAFNKIKDKCTFNKQIILWLRMLYHKNEIIRREGLNIINEIFNDIKELSNDQSSPWNIYYFKNNDISLLENELTKLEDIVYKKTNVDDIQLKTQILKTKALLKDEISLKNNMEELLNIMLNIQKENVKIKEDTIKEINIFIVDVVIEYSDILFNNELIAKIFLNLFFIVLYYQNSSSQSLSKSYDIDINSQFMKNLIILSFHPNRTICYLITKSLSYILFKPDDYQLYINNKKNYLNDNESISRINVNNNLFPIHVVNSFNLYNENVKSVNVFNYRNNENLEKQSIQKIWRILL